jgi:hypothetical protein
MAAAELQPTPDARPLRIDTGAAGLWQMLQRLHTRASLLMITAHPDDEDGGMLAYESRGQGARTMMLTTGALTQSRCLSVLCNIPNPLSLVMIARSMSIREGVSPTRSASSRANRSAAK